MKLKFDESRRRLLQRVSLGVVLAPITGAALRTAWAADLPLVATDDPTAKALKYVPDVSKSTAAKSVEQSLSDLFLANQLTKGLWAPLARNHLILHELLKKGGQAPHIT